MAKTKFMKTSTNKTSKKNRQKNSRNLGAGATAVLTILGCLATATLPLHSLKATPPVEDWELTQCNLEEIMAEEITNFEIQQKIEQEKNARLEEDAQRQTKENWERIEFSGLEISE